MERDDFEYYTNGITIDQLDDIAMKLSANEKYIGKNVFVKNSLTYTKMASISIVGYGDFSITILDVDLFDLI